MINMHNADIGQKSTATQHRQAARKALPQTAYDAYGNSQNSSAFPNFLINNFGLNLSSDDILILGLVLILSEDCNDIWLFLALLYILT